MNTSATTSQAIDINNIKSAVANDIDHLNQLIIKTLHSDIPLIQVILNHILESGGKRMRPLLVLLLANQFNRQHHQQQIELAAIIEFVHTATLLHDDVIDHSTLRRGHNTANAVWGNQAPILVGDFLYSRAFQLLSTRCNPPIMKKLALTTNTLAEGEIMQLANQGHLISESNYFETIYRKTAALFEAACECAAITANQDSTMQQACAEYGKHLGMIFQIQDDILDYTATNDSLGKNKGDDIKEGKATLPLIYAFEAATTAQQKIITEAIQQPSAASESLTESIIEIIDSTAAVAKCQTRLQYHASIAVTTLSALADSPYKNNLQSLVEFSLMRRH